MEKYIVVKSNPFDFKMEVQLIDGSIEITEYCDINSLVDTIKIMSTKYEIKDIILHKGNFIADFVLKNFCENQTNYNKYNFIMV